MTREEAIPVIDILISQYFVEARNNGYLDYQRAEIVAALEMAKQALEKIEELNRLSSIDRLNGNMLWVSPGVYERIKNNPDKIIVESQCQAPLYLKVEGWKK